MKLTNDFHGGEINLRPHRDEWGEYLSQAQIDRADRVLCGISGCTCGGIRPARQIEETSPGTYRFLLRG